MGWCCRAQAPQHALAQDTSVQAEADRRKGAVPEFVTEASGKGKVESFTVLYGRGGEVEHGVVMLRTAADARALARVPAQRQRDAGASAEHGPHAGGLAGRYRHRGGRRAGVAGGVSSSSRRRVQRAALLRRAGDPCRHERR